MSADNTFKLALLRFDGERFVGHALDVECTQELIAYKNIVLECAKALWRRKFPDRARLPQGFEDGFRLQFDRLDEGSAVVPLRRVRVSEQGEFDLGDEFDEAAELIDRAVAAANTDDLLPADLPLNVIPLFRDFGTTLREDEIPYTRARRTKGEAAYTVKARRALAEWLGPSYEDKVDVVGEVRMANVGPSRFALQIEQAGANVLVDGKFAPEQEGRVLQALNEHRMVRLRVVGIGEFATADRMLKRFARVDDVRLASGEALQFDDSVPPIREQLGAIGRSAPPGAWDAVPSDLSVRIDEIVYGSGVGGT